MNVYCPKCEAACPEDAVACSMCGHLLQQIERKVPRAVFRKMPLVGALGAFSLLVALGATWMTGRNKGPELVSEDAGRGEEQEQVWEKHLKKKAERKERIIRLASQRVEGGFTPEAAEDAVQFAMKVSEYAKEKEAGLKDIYADITVAGLFETNMPVEEMAVMAMMLQQESIYLDFTVADLSRRPQNKK